MAKYNETLANRIVSMIAEELCSVSDICKATGISRNTFYKWKRENPVFNEEIEDAMEFRSEVLLSMAYSSIKQRLERHTITEEKDTYIPDETDSGKLKMKSRVIRKKEYLPDLQTIKMILDRADKKMKNEKFKIKNEEHEQLSVEQKISEESINNLNQGQQIADNKIIPDSKRTAIKNIKNSIRMLDGKRCCKSRKKQRYSIRETA